jgi:hypothetical protein
MMGATQMTDIATTSNREVEDSGETSPVTSATNSTETQVLITEQQVLFSTAAAVALPPAKTRRFTEAVWAITASVRAAFVTSSDEARPKRRHYPPRNDYLEDSRMAREMFRL